MSRASADSDQHLRFGVAAGECGAPSRGWRVTRSCGLVDTSRSRRRCIPRARGTALHRISRCSGGCHRRSIEQVSSSGRGRSERCGHRRCRRETLAQHRRGELQRRRVTRSVGCRLQLGNVLSTRAIRICTTTSSRRWCSLRRDASASAGRPLSSITSRSTPVPSRTARSCCSSSTHGSGAANAKPVSMPAGNGIAQFPFVLTRNHCPVKVHRRQMVVIVRIGISVDGDLPTGHRRGNAEVVQRRAAGQNDFLAGDVGVVTNPRMIGEQVQNAAVEYPAPRLAVVQRWCATGRFDHRGDLLGADGVRRCDFNRHGVLRVVAVRAAGN